MLDWIGSGEVVAEGRWCSNDPNEFVNYGPLGPNAVKVRVEVVKIPDAYLWRPSAEMSTLEEALTSAVAWPADKVILF